MKILFKFWPLIIVILILSACNSDSDDDSDSDTDCMKTITIPQTYFVNNQSYSYDITQEVPCDVPEPTVAEIIEPPELENFSYEVLNFLFTSDTGENTSRLQFEIQLSNPNDYGVSGVPILTINADGLEFSGSFSNNASLPCFEINASSSCILTYDQEESLDLGTVNSYELIDVRYLITN